MWQNIAEIFFKCLICECTEVKMERGLVPESSSYIFKCLICECTEVNLVKMERRLVAESCSDLSAGGN